MDQKTKKVIISAVVIIVVFAVGFGSGYLFGKSRRAGEFPGAGGNFQGINGSVDKNTNNRQNKTPNQTQNQPETQTPATTDQIPTVNQAE